MCYQQNNNFFGIKGLIEENLVTFKMNDQDVGCFITCGSGRITQNILESDDMYDGPIISCDNKST